MNYAQQIKHPNWQKKRLEVLEASNFECENCGAKEEELHVHHPFYKRGAMIWQYENHELKCLCHKCHKDAHAIDEQIKLLMQDDNLNKTQLIGYLKGCHITPYTTIDDIDEATGVLQSYGINSRIYEEMLCNHGPNPDKFTLHDLAYVIGQFVDSNHMMFVEMACRHKEERLKRIGRTS